LAFALTNDNVTGLQVALVEWISVPYIAAGLIAWLGGPCLLGCNAPIVRGGVA
jgi:hypothetical protein